MLYWICYFIAYLPFSILFPTKVIGKQNFRKKEKAIYACNHQSTGDVVTIYIKHGKKLRVLSKIELFKNKFFGWFLKKWGAIPVDRKKVGISSIKSCLNVLNNNQQLLIFPTGSRYSSIEEQDNIKNGMAMFALKTGAPIIPMAFNKATKFLRRNKLFVGEPIDIAQFQKDGLTHENLTKVSNIVTQKIKELLREAK